MKKMLLLFLFLFSILNITSQNIEGKWSGVLDVGATKLRLDINITKEGIGYKGTMDSPDQGAKEIPITKISIQDRLLDFSIENFKMSYKGMISTDSIVGTFTQSGQNFPLNFSRNEIVINRPQNPTKPYNYLSEDVKFYNKQADINLAGTFTYPKTGSKFPVAVLITGSGPQNRDEELLGHKPFLVLSNYLTNNGIAVLRFDDRGVGESEGDFSKGTTSDFATDAFAAVEYLKTRAEIDENKIGLIGHSEGGLIAFQIASKYPDDISFVVSMAGPGVSGKEITQLQSKNLSLMGGASDSIASDNQRLALRIIDYVEKYDNEYLKKNIEQIMRTILPEDKQTEEVMKALSNQVAQASSPWFREFLFYDPANDIQTTRAHVLAINGGKDCQVDADVNLKAIESNSINARSKKIKKYLSLNHLFQTANTGGISEYQVIEETIAPEVLKDIADWINELYN